MQRKISLDVAIKNAMPSVHYYTSWHKTKLGIRFGENKYQHFDIHIVLSVIFFFCFQVKRWRGGRGGEKLKKSQKALEIDVVLICRFQWTYHLIQSQIWRERISEHFSMATLLFKLTSERFCQENSQSLVERRGVNISSRMHEQWSKLRNYRLFDLTNHPIGHTASADLNR